MMVLHLHLFI